MRAADPGMATAADGAPGLDGMADPDGDGEDTIAGSKRRAGDDYFEYDYDYVETYDEYGNRVRSRGALPSVWLLAFDFVCFWPCWI